MAKLPERRDDSNRLRTWLDTVVMADAVRPEKVSSIPAAELSAMLQTLKREGASYNMQCKLGFLEHSVTELAQRQDFPSLLVALKPWAHSDSHFDELAPTLGSITEYPLSKRLLHFRTNFFSRIMTPLIMSATQALLPTLAAACKCLIAAFADEDPVELDTACASVMTESLVSARAALAVIDRAFDEENDSDLEALRARKGRSDRSILTSVANAMYGNSLLADTLELYSKNRLVLLQHSPKISAHMTALDSVQASEGGWEVLSAALIDLSHVRGTTAACLFDDFAGKLREALITVSTATIANAQQDGSTLTVEALSLMEKTIAEAAISYSLDDGIQQLQHAISDCVRRQSGTARLKKLSDMLAARMPATATNEEAAHLLASIGSALTDTNGIELPDDFKPKFIEAAQALSDWLLVAVAKGYAEQPMASCLDVLTDFDTRAHDEEIADQVSIAMWVCDLLKLRSAIDSIDAADIDAKSSTNQELSVLILKGRALLASFEADMKPSLEPWHAFATKSLLSSEGVLKAFAQQRMSFMWHSANTACEEVTALTGGLESGEPWHQNKKGGSEQAWQSLTSLAQETVGKLDTKALEQSLTNLKAAYDAGDASMTLAISAGVDMTGDNTIVANDIRAALDLWRKASILLRQAMMLWHLTAKCPREIARRRMQEEVRALRAMGIGGEKAHLPETLYRKVLELITCDVKR